MDASSPPAASSATSVSPLLRFHPRGPPPALQHRHPNCSYGFFPSPASPQQHQNARSQPRLSPRQVKLQRVVPPSPSSSYLTKVSLRDHVTANFRHELLQFHQVLRDAIASCQREQQQEQERSAKAASSSVLFHDRNVLELLTSDRGDAVLKEFFRQFPLQSKSSRDLGCDDTDVLWEVLDTFFKNVPLIVPESEVSNAKSYVRYVDSLHALRGILIAMLYKQAGPKQDEEASGDDEEDGDCENSAFLASQKLLSHDSHSLAPKPHVRLLAKSPHPQQQQRRVPMYLHCQQLERELKRLRERHPNRSRLAGYRTSLQRGEQDDVGLLNDSTLLLLLDFWELPRTERLGFFCQIASQTSEDDAEMLLRVLLAQFCSTQHLLQVWEALQQFPQFEGVFAAAATKYCDALHVHSSNSKGEDDRQSGAVAEEDGAEEEEEEDTNEMADSRKDRRTSRSVRNRQSMLMKGGQGHRASRFVDLNNLTEVFEERDDANSSQSDVDDDDFAYVGEGRRVRKIVIRERGRTPPGAPRRTNSPPNRRRRRQQNHQKNLHYEDASSNSPFVRPLSPSASATDVKKQPSVKQLPQVDPNAPILQRLHDDLVEIIKQDESADLHGGTTGKQQLAPPLVMDTAWKLLELLDGLKGKKPQSKKSQPFQPQSTRSNGTRGSDAVKYDPGSFRLQNAQQECDGGGERRAARGGNGHSVDALGANLTTDQHFMIKFDQLQSLLTSLGTFALHEMATDTISSVYRRMPAIAKLFSVVHEKAYNAAGLDIPPIVVSFSDAASPANHHHSPHRASAAQFHAQSQQIAGDKSLIVSSADDQVLDAASVLMAKVGKLVRSLANLDQLRSGSSSGGGDDSKSTNLDVLAILKLADDLEEAGEKQGNDAASASAAMGGRQRRPTLIDHNRRVAILHKLKVLATSSDLDSVSSMIASTVQGAHERHLEQLEQLEKLNSSNPSSSGGGGSSAAKRRRKVFIDIVEGFDDDGGEDLASSGDDGADEVLKMAKKAKTRRASAATKAHAQAQTQALNQDDDDDEPSNAMLGGRRDVLLNIRQASGQKGVKLFSVGILLRVVYQVCRIYLALCLRVFRLLCHLRQSTNSLAVLCERSRCPDLPRELRKHDVVAPVRQSPHGVQRVPLRLAYPKVGVLTLAAAACQPGSRRATHSLSRFVGNLCRQVWAQGACAAALAQTDPVAAQTRQESVPMPTVRLSLFASWRYECSHSRLLCNMHPCYIAGVCGSSASKYPSPTSFLLLCLLLLLIFSHP